MKFMNVDVHVPSMRRLALTAGVLVLLSWMVLASFGKTQVSWGMVGALCGGAVCSAAGIDSTKGLRELSVASAVAMLFALAGLALHAKL